MDYPEKFIRGVSDTSFVDAGGRASAAIFQFNDMSREDGFFESSINWYDEEAALCLVIEQRKENGEHQFKYGAAIIERSEADRIIRNPLYKDVFRYERSPLDGNRYHGNLLLRKDNALKKSIRTMIAANLALNAQLRPRTQSAV